MIKQSRSNTRFTTHLASCGLAAALLFPVAAHGLIEIGEGRLDLKLAASVEHDSNVFANANQTHDWLLTVSPSIEFGQATGLTNLDFRAGVHIIRFDNLGEQDTEDIFIGGAVSYPNRPEGIRSQFRIDAGWQEFSSADQSLGERIESDRWHIDGDLRSDWSDRLALRGGLRYSETTYEQRQFSRKDVFSLRGETLWRYSEKLENVIGYQYRETTTGGAEDREAIHARDHRVTFGLEGELQPKVAGGVFVGFQARNFRTSDRPSSTRPYYSAHVEWFPTDMTTVTLNGEQDFDTTPDDRSIDSSTVSLTLRQTVGERIWIDPSVSYQRVRYPTRDPQAERRRDNRTGFSIGLNATFAHDVTGRIGYSYLDSDSNRAFSNYDRHIYEVSAAVTF